ncbi:MAG: hypothetical protein COS76_00920 [Candidatus Portnoybacteria bacterium CG06_land_8_20_14_3_00_39_12]|uniref:Alpha-L-rhamnosidase six-hairpin glycosidase domain-containing protein n=2 Tax=Candidatus Portnoyibacteriota TaxID=1817913 RepID=A0A2M7UIG0_9BACT|nr:MAG: hypothetical protein AUJ33_01095 [Parcubacteria group bacterium CG1_02_40_25]PIU75412.1 MAG: hypothetical protein COS76_00920 [Candidatus Portnoybacteria bacterium CG06_land_8_20_14_3_00_39_12]PIZ71014.1 MAG: hypothetical protein COY09_01600 [Candidatus Portnoybacteria bacterium CG_4_10_14_0_2_um_filter_39_11]
MKGKKVILITLGISLAVGLFLSFNNLLQNIWDRFVIKTNFNLFMPWSSKVVWIWSQGEDPNIPYTRFVYHWKQDNKPRQAQLKVSCLGRYQLFINNQSVYHGPCFAIPPKIYFDSIDLRNYIHIGENQISIICNYLNLPIHEYAFYPEPGLLVGGEISDGLIKRNFADHRLWRSAPMKNIQNGEKIAQNAGFVEINDLSTQNALLPTSKSIIKFDYAIYPRPIPLLTYQLIVPKQIPDSLFDLGRFAVGYLRLRTNFRSGCSIKLTWGVGVNKDNAFQPNFNQIDQLKIPAGKVIWEQFSRRAGRYIQIEKNNCVGDFDLELNGVSMPFNEAKLPIFDQEIDQKIYQISANTLKNNIQDHFEDSVDRERAMYLGDTLAMSKCLISDGNNFDLIKEMISQFAQSQRQDGSFPSMTPSGIKQFIPSYSLQWAALLDLYLSKTNDKEFAQEMYVVLRGLINWAKNHESENGFLYNKQNSADWWSFIDWTPFDESYEFSTSLQLWYFRALVSAGNIVSLIGESNDEYINRANLLKQNLIRYSFDNKTGLFSDSFDEENRSKGGLIINALAGKFNVFPSQIENNKALDYFVENFITDSPFSETWIIDWLVKTKQYDLALDTIQTYWGGMINDGATSVYETYRPGTPMAIGTYSHSHAWGCGPVYLYKNILDKNSAMETLLDY